MLLRLSHEVERRNGFGIPEIVYEEMGDYPIEELEQFLSDYARKGYKIRVEVVG